MKLRSPEQQETLAKRFLKHCDVRGTCLIWHGASTDKGYGRFWLDSRVHKAHRAAHIIFLGKEYPPDVPLLHKEECGTRDCVNWEHTYPGTVQENNRQVNAKRRKR